METKKFSVYNYDSFLGVSDKFTLEQFTDIIENTKKDYPQFKWVEFYIESSMFNMFGGFSVIACRELTQEEKDVDKRRAEYEVLKKEFEPKAKESA